MKTLIINNHTAHLKELVNLFPDSTVVSKEDFNAGLDTSVFQLIVMSGGSDVPTVLRHPEKYRSEIDLVKNSHIPILGICLGNEIIIKSFGGELKELNEQHRGIVNIKIEDGSLKDNLESETLTAPEAHKIGILNLANELISCGSSEHSIEIIKHKSRPIIGLGFHPEISPNKKLLNWIFKELNLTNQSLSQAKQTHK